MNQGRLFCTLRLERHLFGIEVAWVQEVLRAARLTPVPLAPAGLAGLINLRGQVVTVFELRTLVGLPPRPPDAKPLSLIIRSPEGPMSLFVDEIGDVIGVTEDSFETPPETLQGQGRDLIAGAYKLKDRLLLALDMDRLLSVITTGAGRVDPRITRPNTSKG